MRPMVEKQIATHVIANDNEYHSTHVSGKRFPLEAKVEKQGLTGCITRQQES